MTTDITASTKPEYPVIDRNPPFTNVVSNFSTLDYLRFVTITGVSVTVGCLSGIKPGTRGPSMVTGGLIGIWGGFMYAFQNSAGRLMGFFPNEDEIYLQIQSMNLNKSCYADHALVPLIHKPSRKVVFSMSNSI